MTSDVNNCLFRQVPTQYIHKQHIGDYTAQHDFVNGNNRLTIIREEDLIQCKLPKVPTYQVIQKAATVVR